MPAFLVSGVVIWTPGGKGVDTPSRSRPKSECLIFEESQYDSVQLV